MASSPDSGAVAKRRGAAAAKAAAGESEDDGGSLDITSVDSGGESGRRKKCSPLFSCLRKIDKRRKEREVGGAGDRLIEPRLIEPRLTEPRLIEP